MTESCYNFWLLVARIGGQMRRFTLASPVLTVLLSALASVTTTHAAQKVARIGVPGAVAAAKARGADLLYVVPDAIFTGNRIPDLAAMAGLPLMSIDPRFAPLGGLISYGPDYLAISRLGAHYVDRILKGAKPADLPIEQSDKYMLVLNLKSARSLGIEIPASLLARADEVIE